MAEWSKAPDSRELSSAFKSGECSGPRMWAWVRIPLLTHTFWPFFFLIPDPKTSCIYFLFCFSLRFKWSKYNASTITPLFFFFLFFTLQPSSFLLFSQLQKKNTKKRRLEADSQNKTTNGFFVWERERERRHIDRERPGGGGAKVLCKVCSVITAVGEREQKSPSGFSSLSSQS